MTEPERKAALAEWLATRPESDAVGGERHDGEMIVWAGRWPNVGCRGFPSEAAP